MNFQSPTREIHVRSIKPPCPVWREAGSGEVGSMGVVFVGVLGPCLWCSTSNGSILVGQIAVVLVCGVVMVHPCC